MFQTLKAFGKKIKQEIKFYKILLKDRRTPLPAKIILAIAIAYALSPIDLIPDFIPVLGFLDDVVIVPVLIFIALRFIPNEIVSDCRNLSRKHLSEIGYGFSPRKNK